MLAAELGYRVTALDLSEGMLAKARAKAEERGLDLSFEVGSAMTPPGGPFDAVMERHVLWTMPDPVGALRAWRDADRVRRPPRAVRGLSGARRHRRDRAKRAMADLVRRLMRVEDHHHAPYPDEVLASLPLARMPSPAPLVEAVYEAGWTAVRIRRLRDVEWTARLHEPAPLGWLEHMPRYALVADRA